MSENEREALVRKARGALGWYDDDSEGGGGIVLGGMAVAEALRDLLALLDEGSS